jgi:hypothetical protein
MDAIVVELESVHHRLGKAQAYRGSEERPTLLLSAIKDSAVAQVMSYHRGDALSTLAAAPHLKTITDQSISAYQLKGLAASPELEVLELSFCGSLRRLSPTSGAAHVKEISVQGSDVDEISGLAKCLLEALNLSDCTHLTSLASRAGAQRIHRT